MKIEVTRYQPFAATSANPRGVDSELSWAGPVLAEPESGAGDGEAGSAQIVVGESTADSATLVFAEKEPLGYVSDHIGLRTRLSLTPTAGNRLTDGGGDGELVGLLSG